MPPPLGRHPIGAITDETRGMLVSIASPDNPAGTVPPIVSGYAGEYDVDGETLRAKVVAA